MLYVDLFVYFPAFLFCSSCSEVLSFYLGSTLVSCGGMNCVCDHFQVPWLLGSCIPSSRVDLVCAVVLVYSDSGVAASAWYLRLTCSLMLMRAIAYGGFTYTVRESALKVDWEENPLSYWGAEPASEVLGPNALSLPHPHPPLLLFIIIGYLFTFHVCHLDEGRYICVYVCECVCVCVCVHVCVRAHM